MNSLLNKENNEDQAETALRQQLTKLDLKRKSIEHEADAIFLELTTPPDEGVEPMGIDTPLVDQDGYPRGDIDIYRTRTLRRQFRTLKTDHKDITAQIEGMLRQLTAMKHPNKDTDEQMEVQARRLPKPKPKYDPVTGKWVVMNWDGTVAGIPGGEKRNFADVDSELSGLTGDGDSDAISSLASSVVNSTRSANTADLEPHPPAEVIPRSDSGIKPPFARVDAVASGSPADEAGLKDEDLIVTFGPIHQDNNDHLKAIADLVPYVAGEQIEICLLRHQIEDDDWETVNLKLTPRPWSGRGLLGCHIVPYSK